MSGDKGMRKIFGRTSHESNLWKEVCKKELNISSKLEDQYYDRDEGVWVQRPEKLYFRPGGAPDPEGQGLPPITPPPGPKMVKSLEQPYNLVVDRIIAPEEKLRKLPKKKGDGDGYDAPNNFHFLKLW